MSARQWILPLPVLLFAVGALIAADKETKRLSYNDGTAESKKSLGGSGPILCFTLANEESQVAGVRIHGSRYGTDKPPQESFVIYFLSGDLSDTVATKTVPYSRFKKGEAEWVEIKFPKPIAVPKEFCIAIDFRATRPRASTRASTTAPTAAIPRRGCRESRSPRPTWAAIG